MQHFDLSAVGRDKFLMQLGTLAGNPIAAVAGLKTMEILRRPGNYEKLHANGERLQKLLSKHLSNAGHEHQIIGENSLFDVLFTRHPVTDYRTSKAVDTKKNNTFNAVLRANGILKSPTKLYPCLALTDADFELTDHAIQLAAAAL